MRLEQSHITLEDLRLLRNLLNSAIQFRESGGDRNMTDQEMADYIRRYGNIVFHRRYGPPMIIGNFLVVKVRE